MTTTVTQKRMTRSLIVLTTLAVVACMYWTKPILVPLAFAVFFSLLLMPLADLLNRWLPRLAAAAVATVVGIAGVGALAFAAGKQILALAETLPSTVQALLTRVRDFTPSGAAFLPIRKGMDSMLAQLNSQTVAGADAAQVPAVKASDAMDLVATFINPLASMSIICIMVVLILWDRDSLIERIVRTFGRGEMNVTTQALADVRARISRYLTAQLLSNVFFASATCLGLLLLGIPNILAWCLVTVFLRFIPYVGILIAASVPILLTAGQGGWEVLYVLALYIGVEAVLVSLIEPIWLGQSAGISALALVFSAIFWTFLWGLPGLFLATPLTVCLLMVGKHIPQLAFLNTLLSSETVLDPPARMYQRLLTQEPKDAVAYIKQEITARPLLEVTDQAFFPSLRMAELDRHHGRLSAERAEKLKETLILLSQSWPTHIAATDLTNLAAKYSLAEYDRKFLDSHSVVCVAAADEADQVASSLLHNLLGALKIPSSELSKDCLVGEAVERIVNSPAEIIVISSVPPQAMAPVRYFLKQLHRRRCQKRVLVGFWGERQTRTAAWLREDFGPNVEFVRTLEDGLRVIHRWTAGLAVENRPAIAQKQAYPVELAGTLAR